MPAWVREEVLVARDEEEAADLGLAVARARVQEEVTARDLAEGLLVWATARVVEDNEGLHSHYG
jgi:hypothetical protein